MFCPSSVRRNFRNISCVMAGYRSLNGTIRWYSKKGNSGSLHSGVIFHLCSGKVNGLFISQIEHIGYFSPFIYLFILLFKALLFSAGNQFFIEAFSWRLLMIVYKSKKGQKAFLLVAFVFLIQKKNICWLLAEQI